VRDRTKTAIALALLLAVVALFVLPALASPVTALRSKQYSQLFFLTIAIAATVLAGMIRAANDLIPAPVESGLALRDRDLVDLTSARLC
jgi:hypothetical protein